MSEPFVAPVFALERLIDSIDDRGREPAVGDGSGV